MKIPEPIQIAQDGIFELDLFVKLAWAWKLWTATC